MPLASRVINGRTYYRVVDTAAGYDDKFNPKSVVASCNVESHAETIAKAFNAAAEIDPATGVPRALINRLPSYDDLQDENKTLREENAAMSVQHDAYQRQLASQRARISELEGINSTTTWLRNALQQHLPLPKAFTITDLDREMTALQHRLADAMVKAVAWDEQTLTKILKARLIIAEENAKRLTEERDDLHNQILNAAPNRCLGQLLPDYIKQVEANRDEWMKAHGEMQEKNEELRNNYNTLLGEAKTVAKVVQSWMR